MIEIRPLNSVHTLGDQDAVIGRFADFEWRDLIELAQQYGFDPPDIQSYYPRPGDPPFEIDAESSQGLWESISAVHHADAVPPSKPATKHATLEANMLPSTGRLKRSNGTYATVRAA